MRIMLLQRLSSNQINGIINARSLTSGVYNYTDSGDWKNFDFGANFFLKKFDKKHQYSDTYVLKFKLHISKEYQAIQFNERLSIAEQRWK